MLTPAPALLPTAPAPSFAERFWALAPGGEQLDVPEPLPTVVIVRHFLAVLDALGRGQRKPVTAIGAMLRSAEIDGCASYASPEQLRGEPLDTRSVVFSLGVVLFERLAGRHPFGAENNRPRRITRIQRGEMGSGVNSFPTIAASVRSVLVRAMNPFPEERWADVRPMRDLLEQFLAADAPPPRLPGTAASDEVLPEPTRVVRRATDFGRELMDVVARHERSESPSPRPPRPTPPPTPRLGVTALRPPAPRRLAIAPDDDSITRIDPSRIDPLGETMRLTMDRALAGDAHDDDSQASITAPLPAAASVLPGPVETLDRPLSRAPSFDTPVPDLRVASRSKTLLVALASAAIGAGLASIAVIALRPESPRAAAENRTPDVAEIRPAEPVAENRTPSPDTVAEIRTSDAAEIRTADEPAARLQAAVTPCLVTRQTFGLSVVARGSGAKAYFGGSDGLTSAERSCISQAVKPLASMPAEAAYKIRVDDAGVSVSAR